MHMSCMYMYDVCCMLYVCMHMYACKAHYNVRSYDTEEKTDVPKKISSCYIYIDTKGICILLDCIS